MPSYKLTYWNGRGHAEVARQLFHFAGVPYEDNRVTMEEWATLKAKMPFAQVPLLEVDGKQLPQSYAINRYLAKEFGFVGASAFDSAWVDAIADQYKDYFNEITAALTVFMGFAQGDKPKLVKEVIEPARDKFFPALEKIAKENGNNGHFVGTRLTWVDLLLADHIHTVSTIIPGFLDAYPTVAKTAAYIENVPKLKEWIAKRPVNAF
ncbi:hypothetical protein PFISCL1PPCAC_27941 [Pristionchus fissidentatus]|uniref:glutathione transferase n=1 Tax=Pristionchus fissidentatus TaxID=1538716 RepID=A0AAV5X0W1_9BILA|nr:hypothetical protein PFISCL1PPCAC_27941 [Pristionchus fissidentatus]